MKQGTFNRFPMMLYRADGPLVVHGPEAETEALANGYGPVPVEKPVEVTGDKTETRFAALESRIAALEAHMQAGKKKGRE